MVDHGSFEISEGGSLRSGLEYLIFHSFTWSFGRGRIGRVSWTSMAENMCRSW